MTRYGLAVLVLTAAACGGAVNDQGTGIGGAANAGAGGGPSGNGGALGGASGAIGGASGGSVTAGASNDAGPPKICSPGQEIGCYCGGGVDGLQFCNSEGTGYGSCQGCVPRPEMVGGYAGMGGAGAGGSGGSGALGGSGGAGDAGDADASAGDAGDADASAGDAGETPTDMPSRQTVTFKLHNGATEKWVVTQGASCTPFAIAGVELIAPFSCVCECAGPPPEGATRLTHVAPGETLTMTWDARQLVRWSIPIDCATRGWPGMVSSELHYVMQPAAAGSYRATFAYEATTSTMSYHCYASGQDFTCSPSPSGYFGPAGICGSTKTVAQDFTLDADGGAVSVDVNLD